MAQPTVICFAGDRWDGNPHSSYHLLRRLVQGWEVLFVEGVANDQSLWREGRSRRVFDKLAKRRDIKPVATGLHVLRPIPGPPARGAQRPAPRRGPQRGGHRGCLCPGGRLPPALGDRRRRSPQGVSLEVFPNGSRSSLPSAYRRGMASPCTSGAVDWEPGVLTWRDTVDAPPGAEVAWFVQLPDDCRPDQSGFHSDRFLCSVETPRGGLSLQACRSSDRYASVVQGKQAVVRCVSSGLLLETPLQVRKR